MNIFYQIKNILRKILPYRIILWTHKIRAVFAAVSCGFPAKKIFVIGVAGTKGKTTVCNLIARILEQDGKKVAMITTANLKIGKKEWLNKVKMTTPSSFFIQKFLRQAVAKKCDYAIIETTSHGLVQYRHWGIPYQIVVLTNLMPDHLDYHKTYENYRDSHLRLFNKNLKTLILNKDDERLEYFAEKFKKYYETNEIVYFSIKNQANFFADEIELEKEGTVFELVCNGQTIKINSPLLGEFNASNCLAAAAAGSVCKVSLDKIKNALEKIKGIEGRLEKIKMAGQNFEVIVDYAHSPDSLETFYKTVVPYAKGKIIAVLGACGDRDKTYRPALGKLAAKYADYVIVTNEDPYSEKPEDIIEQVSQGVEEILNEKKKNKVQSSKFKVQSFFKILDRREAIKKAIDLAEENDLVLITGKGAEQWIVYGASGEKKIPWDDREVAREMIRENKSIKKEQAVRSLRLLCLDFF
jgi:UDP-N-acetylmuramoyl-L-alanyl-D-glutamate--2,6-diaminopimelate ligase